MLQTRRLGAHLASLCRQHTLGPVRRIFTSNLQRAYQTAEAIAEAQSDGPSAAKLPEDETSAEPDANARRRRRRPSVVQLTELREKDFGSDEGKRPSTRAAERRKPGAPPSDAETREAMGARAERFLTAHLEPFLAKAAEDPMLSDEDVIVIVAHGIILNSLARALIARYPARARVHHGSPPGSSEFSAVWSNTGVLLARLRVRVATPLVKLAEGKPCADRNLSTDEAAKPRVALGPFVIESMNNVEHLDGLKKTRGGIGSLKFDSRQKTMDTFFTPRSKKQKHDGSG